MFCQKLNLSKIMTSHKTATTRLQLRFGITLILKDLRPADIKLCKVS